MHNQEIAWVLAQIADYMEILGDNPHKIRSFRKGSQLVESLETPVGMLINRGQLEKIPGIGEGLLKQIKQLVLDGESEFHQKLSRQIPPSVLEMLRIPNVGPKSVREFFANGITTLEELEEAAKARKLRLMKGMGSKTELAILRGLDMLRRRSGKFSIGIARPLAASLLQMIQNLPEVSKAEVAGSLRRGQDMVEEVYLLVGTNHSDTVLTLLKKHPLLNKILEEGPDFLKFKVAFGLTVFVELVDPERFIVYWVQRTGNEHHWQFMQERIESSIKEVSDALLQGQFFSPSDAEQDLYNTLGMQWVPPEIREDENALHLAVKHQLPNLVQLNDIKGDLHLHTNWSDGVSTIEEMASACWNLGYEYMAVTDHSQSLGIARGLTEEKLAKQLDAIRALEGKFKGLTILAGIEMDILADARLDYTDEILQELDVVVASVHTGLQQEGDKIKLRLEAALKNPHVDIIGHPTGRLLGRREPYHIDCDWLFAMAKKTNTALEINASPDRLDLNAEHARLAKDHGVVIAINTDAHDQARLTEMAYGVVNARRGWLEPSDVLNTRPLKHLMKFLQH